MQQWWGVRSGRPGRRFFSHEARIARRHWNISRRCSQILKSFTVTAEPETTEVTIETEKTAEPTEEVKTEKTTEE